MRRIKWENDDNWRNKNCDVFFLSFLCWKIIKSFPDFWGLSRFVTDDGVKLLLALLFYSFYRNEPLIFPLRLLPHLCSVFRKCFKLEKVQKKRAVYIGEPSTSGFLLIHSVCGEPQDFIVELHCDTFRVCWAIYIELSGLPTKVHFSTAHDACSENILQKGQNNGFIINFDISF